MREYLIEIRKNKNYTQAIVAEKLNITESYYCLIESGERQKTLALDMAQKLADIFEVPISYIIDQEQKLKASD